MVTPGMFSIDETKAGDTKKMLYLLLVYFSMDLSEVKINYAKQTLTQSLA